MRKDIAVLEGDGIGPEVIKEAIKVLEIISKNTKIKFNYMLGLVGASAIDKTGNPFPEETKKICKASDAILFGAIGDPKYDNDPKAKVRPEDGLLEMRKFLGLYANIRPVKTYQSIIKSSPLKEEIVKDVDFIVYRELTGGIYFGDKGFKDNGDTAYDTCSYTRREIKRISSLAFQEAIKRKCKLTLVDKANVLSTSRLWREVVQDLSRNNFPEVSVDYLFVDNAAMKIITNPSDFGIILTENMFGDIITDEASVITGSLGMLPSASVGSNISLFEPIHGSYPQAVGKNIANPMAMILSAGMMLNFSFNMNREEKTIKRAVNDALNEGVVTQDLNNHKYYKTNEVGDWISKRVDDLSN